MNPHRRVAVFDTETTGLSFDKGARIVEVAFVVVVFPAGGKPWVESSYSSLCNPGRAALDHPGTVQAFEVNGIDPAQVEAAPADLHVFELIRSGFNGVRLPAVWTSYNTAFDGKFLLSSSHSIQVLGAPKQAACLMEAVRAYVNRPEVQPSYEAYLDSVYPPDRPQGRTNTRADGTFGSPKLLDAAAFLTGRPVQQTHRALPDAKLAVQVMLALYRLGAWSPDPL